jgi:hypothetical protein
MFDSERPRLVLERGQRELKASATSDIRILRKPHTPPCDFCGGEFEDGEDAYRLAKGKVQYSVPSFVPETASLFFHEECWKRVTVERKKGAAKQPRPERQP